MEEPFQPYMKKIYAITFVGYYPKFLDFYKELYLNLQFFCIPGKSGNWKSVFTVAQSEMFTQWMRDGIQDDNKEFPTYLD